MCTRAHVECVGPVGRMKTRKSNARTSQRSPATEVGTSLLENDPISRPGQTPVPESHERLSDRILSSVEDDQESSHGIEEQNAPVPECRDPHSNADAASELTSSATTALVETALLYENMPNSTYARTPGAASQFTQPSPGDQPVSAGPRALVEDYSPVDINGPVQRGKRPRRPTYLRLQERLLSVLPGPEATKLLIDTYFDRAHWFMLVFHQQKFRQQLQQLQNDPHFLQDGSTSTAGFIAVLLPVVCIGLQYLGEYRETLLATYGIRREALQHEIIAALEESFLNIVSLGSLEAVQSCVLLGTFYLYHSESAMAWSICGCALRIAQAIKLQRSWPPSHGKQSSLSDGILQQISERKRCWWALYEVETFCCMLYGYTCSIRDQDCDMDFLTHQREDLTEGHSEARPTPAFTLLSYKVNMSKLSVILKTALSKLYGHCTGSQNSARRNQRLGDMQQELVFSIGDLNRRLNLWHTELPPELKMRTSNHSGYENIEQSERDVGGSGQPFDTNIVQLQALALKLAYENAQILVNRPLFTYKLSRLPGHIRQSKTPDGRDVENSHAVQESFRICRQAALRTAGIGEDSAFKFAFRSFAAAFMSTHLFTAGVTLCLSAIIEPLTEHATQAKVGLQKLFSLQNDPTSEPLASPHVTKVLERLIRVILEKELSDILGTKRRIAPQTVGTRQASPTIHVNNPSNDCSQIHRDGSAQAPATNVGVVTCDNGNAPSNADSHDGNYMPTDVFRDDANVPSSLFPGQDEFDFSDDFLSMVNDPLFTDQEQAWIWNMDPWP